MTCKTVEWDDLTPKEKRGLEMLRRKRKEVPAFVPLPPEAIEPNDYFFYSAGRRAYLMAEHDTYCGDGDNHDWTLHDSRVDPSIRVQPNKEWRPMHDDPKGKNVVWYDTGEPGFRLVLDPSLDKTYREAVLSTEVELLRAIVRGK